MFQISKSFAKQESKKPLVIGVFEIEKQIKINQLIDQEIEQLIEEKQIILTVGKVNKIYTFNKIKHQVIYIIGLGKREDFSYEKLEESLREVNYKMDNELILDLASFTGDLDYREVAKRVVQTIGYYNYKYDECLSDKINNDLLLNIVTNHDISKEIEEAFNIVVAIDNTRDLVNKPYNYLSAIDLANYAENLAESLNHNNLKIKIYDKKEIEKLEMNAFLGVNKGSTSEPRLIHIKFENADLEPLALIGKGLMFDTGGYSLKQTMNNMKNDMAGAATVLGALELAVKSDLKINLQVIICATDNRINGEALVPDDVLTAMNKKTIEIISTDAEGRLTLADAVCFAQKEGCREIIDVATLTGSVVIALGDYTTGLFGNNYYLINKMSEASQNVNESIWNLPITDHIRKQVRGSKVADLLNSTGRAMGASGAAAFIEAFVANDVKWMHLDIAGTAFHTSPSYKEFYGASGTMVKTLYQYLKMKIV